MQRKSVWNQIRFKIVAWIFVISLASSICLSYWYYQNYKTLIEKNTISLTLSNISFIMNMVDSRLSAVEVYANSLLSSEEFYGILAGEHADTPENRMNIVKLQDEMRLQMYRTIVQDYVDRVLIYGRNDVMIQWSNSFGNVNDAKEVENWPYFGECLSNPHFDWFGISDGIISNNLYTRKVIPVLRPFYADSAVDQVGYLYIEVSDDILKDIISEYSISDSSELFIFNKRGTYITHNRKGLVGTSIDFYEEIAPFLNEKSGNMILDVNGMKEMFVYSRSEYTGWVIVQAVPMSEFALEQRTFLRLSLIMVLVSIFLVVLISIFVSKTMTKPIIRIVRHVKNIQAGDFSVNPDIEAEDEIGQIGKAINGMAVSISRLLEDNREKERAAKDLELEVLQSQINPHFLYNTLNSIKWMATIQKNESIVNVVVSLSRLLRNIAKGVSGKVTLDEELFVLKEYINIQTLRYGEKFEIYFDEELGRYGNCLIVKFILQPLVENAIFHGIEPKEGTGNIFITACSEGDNLQIIVEDDGVGMMPLDMEKEDESKPSEGKAVESKGRFSRIGIRNIEDRIKLAYGAEYGLEVESELGRFTRVIITVPREYGESEQKKKPKAHENIMDTGGNKRD